MLTLSRDTNFRIILFILFAIILLTIALSFANGTRGAASAIGTYPPAEVGLGGNTSVVPDGPPVGALRLIAYTNTNFKGTLEADPVTGVVRVTNAHPIGVYPITLVSTESSGASSTAFALTVTNVTSCSNAALGAVANTTVGNGPRSAVPADFNRDGKQDLVTANFNGDNVSIALGNGSGGFSLASSHATGAKPISVAVGDINGDGSIDIVTTNYYSNDISVLLGDGNGNFGAAVSYGGAGSYPYFVALGDFNRDNKLDAAVASSGTTQVMILLGDGLGAFGSATAYGAGGYPNSIAVGDLNNDGRQDIVTANSGTSVISVLLGSSSGGFEPVSGFEVAFDPIYAGIADINLDGKQDVLTANRSSNNVTLRLGDGTGGFGPAANFAVGSQPFQLAVGDINGDGKPDVTTADYLSDQVSVLLGDGLGGFTPIATYPVGSAPIGIALGDFNGDGRLDPVTANSGTNLVSVLINECQTICTASPAGMVNWWRGDNNINDSIGTSNATLANGATYAVGKVGQAFSFDGVDDYASMPASSNWAFGTGDFTVEFWEYADGNIYKRPLVNNRSNVQSESEWAIEVYNATNRVEVHSGFTILLTATNPLNSSSWNHIAVTRTSGTLTIYINGVASGNVANANNFSDIHDLQIARDLLPPASGDLAGNFQGKIDELAIFGRGLTVSEIQKIYNAGDAGVCPVVCNQAPPNIAGWWTGNGHANDVIGVNHGDLVNGVTYDAGKVGQAFSFNGSNYIEIPDSPSLRPATFTVAAWVNPTDISGNHNVVFKGDHEYLLQLRNGKVLYGSRDAAGNYSEFLGSLTVAANNWSHVAITHDGTTRRIYVNGALDPVSQPDVGHYTTNLGTLKIGTHNLIMEFFTGRIDEVALFGRALTLTEIAAIYQAGGLGICAPVYPQPKPQFDFDGDLKSDVSVFRPTVGEWWILQSGGGGFATQFGAATDTIVPVDFTGDGKTDIAYWRPSGGFWYVLRSEDFTYYAFPFGGTGDIPAPADYDGDGKADAAVFRPSNTTWYMSWSTGPIRIRQFGLAGDMPVPGDYDGDRLADIAVYRPNGANGAEWWISQSSGGVFATQFGQSTNKAVPADFTGDKRTDIAVWDPASGFWYVLRSDDLSYYAFPFGAAGDLPIAGDFDGDGKADPGVFRPSTANWYVNRSTAGILIQQFGQSGDLPLPNAFVR